MDCIICAAEDRIEKQTGPLRANLALADYRLAIAVFCWAGALYGRDLVLRCEELSHDRSVRIRELAAHADPRLFLGQLLVHVVYRIAQRISDDVDRFSSILCFGVPSIRNGPALGNIFANHPVLHIVSRAHLLVVRHLG